MTLDRNNLKMSPLYVSHESSFQSLTSTDHQPISHQQRECHVTKKQFKLLELEFTRVISAHCPKIEILKRKSKTIILKGPIKEVQTGAAKLDALIKELLDKRVKLPQDLMTFLKSSGVVSKYQADFELRFINPVSLEVGSDLVLSGLCSHDLDEALAILLRDLSLEIEKLQGAAALPPHADRMKEILIKTKNQVNHGGPRVDVTFIPGSTANTLAKVRLVGYTEHVNKLRDVLRDFLHNQVPAEEVLNLPFPELVYCFEEVLELLHMKQTKAALKASLSPRPCVVMSGPLCLVQETHEALKSALASLTSEALVLNGPGALRYFQGDGEVSKELVESSCQVLIRQESGKKMFPQLLNQGTLRTGSTGQQSTFLIFGLHRNHVNDAVAKMKNLYQAHCATKTFTKNDLADLTQGDMKDLKKLAETEGLYVQKNLYGDLLVSGLKAGVSQVEQMLHSIAPLRREMRLKEEENLYPRVAWCILGRSGNWERLPKAANYNLENCNIAKGIVDAQGTTWSVNLQRTEATCQRLPTKLKRLENLEDFSLPLYWDAMAPAEDLKQVLVDPSSAEYNTVLQAFRKTINKTVVKIERLQNVHLRRVYEMQKKHMSEKNRQEGGAGERLLYHGTSQENYNSIKTKGFNRSFSGKNATVFGLGTYFAVNASYSATYSMPASDGTQAMFVARVLTGVYTQGHSNMKVPPARNIQQPDDRCDSLVDRMDNPSMFVVFHDDQAYPDYFITFY